MDMYISNAKFQAANFPLNVVALLALKPFLCFIQQPII